MSTQKKEKRVFTSLKSFLCFSSERPKALLFLSLSVNLRGSVWLLSPKLCFSFFKSSNLRKLGVDSPGYVISQQTMWTILHTKRRRRKEVIENSEYPVGSKSSGGLVVAVKQISTGFSPKLKCTNVAGSNPKEQNKINKIM